MLHYLLALLVTTHNYLYLHWPAALAMANNKLPALPLAAVLLLALAAPSLAGDPDMLQDICVADYKSLNGRK